MFKVVSDVKRQKVSNRVASRTQSLLCSGMFSCLHVWIETKLPSFWLVIEHKHKERESKRESERESERERARESERERETERERGRERERESKRERESRQPIICRTLAANQGGGGDFNKENWPFC